MTFQVNVKETLSQTAEAISGVPQGYVLCPILSDIYVNDLPDHLSADSLFYADNVKLITLHNNFDIHQSSLNVRASYYKHWGLGRDPNIKYGDLHSPVPEPTQHADNHHQKPGNCLKNRGLVLMVTVVYSGTCCLLNK